MKDFNTLEDIAKHIKEASNVLVLTGAGVSVSCGIPDFRSKVGLPDCFSFRFVVFLKNIRFGKKKKKLWGGSENIPAKKLIHMRRLHSNQNVQTDLLLDFLTYNMTYNL